MRGHLSLVNDLSELAFSSRAGLYFDFVAITNGYLMLTGSLHGTSRTARKHRSPFRLGRCVSFKGCPGLPHDPPVIVVFGDPVRKNHIRLTFTARRRDSGMAQSYGCF